jgi:DNA-binding IscR family transcriptional regulator
VARRALAGEAPARLEDLATGIGAPVAVLDDLVGDLVAHGVLLRAAEPEGIALARPPDRVTAAEALAVVRDPQPAADRHPLAVDDAVLELLAARDRATQTVLGEVTLAALASRPATAPSILTPLTRARR